MRQEYISIPPKGAWGIVVVTDFDTEYEREELLAQLRSFGLTYKSANHALDILSNYNTGMALSIPDFKMSAIYIGKSTSPSEFYSTAIHECIHVADSILDWYGEKWDGEPSAYLVGFLTKEIVMRFGEPCR
jgi:hypothetical protein